MLLGLVCFLQSFSAYLCWFVPQLALSLALGIPLLISLFATVTDEMAESGADRFRLALTARKLSVNAQWSFTGFYLGAARGVLFPKASNNVRDEALVLVFV